MMMMMKRTGLKNSAAGLSLMMSKEMRARRGRRLMRKVRMEIWCASRRKWKASGRRRGVKGRAGDEEEHHHRMQQVRMCAMTRAGRVATRDKLKKMKMQEEGWGRTWATPREAVEVQAP